MQPGEEGPGDFLRPGCAESLQPSGASPQQPKVLFSWQGRPWCTKCDSLGVGSSKS